MKFDYQHPDETIMHMCEGNPGALTAMLTLHKAAFGENPQHGQWPWEMVKICDELEIYGSRLYMLWSDCLSRDIAKMADLAKAYRAGIVSADFIREQIAGNGYRGYQFSPADLANNAAAPSAVSVPVHLSGCVTKVDGHIITVQMGEEVPE